MTEISYGTRHETADLANRSVREARKLFSDEMGIPGNATARLNGRKIKGSLEAETLLGDCDTLSFTRPAGKGAFLIGALLLSLVITGGIFAYTYTNASTTLNVVAGGGDFAAISVNNTSTPSWTPFGSFQGSTGGGTLFDVDTATSGYTGDLTITVSIANGDSLVEAYRVLSLFIEMRDSSNNLVDINGDGANNTADFALLTMRNGSVELYVTQTSVDSYTVRLKNGFYVSNTWGAGGWAGSEAPVLYAEVAQR